MGGSAAPKRILRKGADKLKDAGKKVIDKGSRLVKEGLEDVVGKEAADMTSNIISSPYRGLTFDFKGAAEDIKQAGFSGVSIFADEDEEAQEFQTTVAEADIKDEPVAPVTRTKFTGEEGVEGPLNPGKKKRRGRGALIG